MMSVDILCAGLAMLLFVVWRMIPSSSPQASEQAPDGSSSLPVLPESEELKDVCYTTPWQTMILPFCPLCGSEKEVRLESIGLSCGQYPMRRLTFTMICKNHTPSLQYAHNFETCEDGSLWYVGSVSGAYAFQHGAIGANFHEEEYSAIVGA